MSHSQISSIEEVQGLHKTIGCNSQNLKVPQMALGVTSKVHQCPKYKITHELGGLSDKIFFSQNVGLFSSQPLVLVSIS